MADLANAVVMPVPSPGGSGSSKIAVTIDPFVVANTYEILGRGAVGGATVGYVNRVYDAVASGNVTWVTLNSPDIATGASYPGPGTFDPTESGADTSQHTIVAVLDDSQL